MLKHHPKLWNIEIVYVGGSQILGCLEREYDVSVGITCMGQVS